MVLHRERYRLERGVHRQRPLRGPSLVARLGAVRLLEERERRLHFVEIAAHADVANGELEHAEPLVRGEARDGIALDLVAVKLIHRDVEQTDVAVDVLAVPPRPAEPLADLHDLVGYPRLVAVRQHVVDVVLDVLGHVPARKVHRRVHVPSAVRDAQDPVKVLHGIDQEGEVVAGTDDALGAPPSLHGREVLAGQLVVFPEVRPEILPVARVQKVQIRLADVNVIHGGVAVQLLVPLLDERILDAGAMALLDAVLAHDLEDAETNVVAVAAASGKRGERRAIKLTRHAILGLGRRVRDATRHHLLHVRHVLALIVPARVPRQLTDGGEAKRRHDARRAGGARLLGLAELIVDAAETLVQRPAAWFLAVGQRLEHSGGGWGL